MGSYALLVSTDRYADPTLRQLRSPRADVEALAAVLADPRIGDFTVRTLHNAAAHEARLALDELFQDRLTGDLVVLYFSCHGVKDDRARLHFAFADTIHDRLPATAIGADFITDLMDQSPARRILLLLDCCFSGAFTRGMRARAGGQVDVVERFTGRGRAVITASSAMEYAFELEPDAEILDARPVPSVFTSVLVQALTTGDADRGGDGWVSVDELYDYVYDEVRARTTRQTPNRWFDVEGAMVVARAASPLPDELLQLAADPNPAVRVTAVPRLYQLAAGGGPPGVAGAARRMLAWLRDDDSRAVSGEAQRALAALPPLPTPQPRPPPHGRGDRTAPWSPPPRPEGWAAPRPGDADRIAVAWRATVIYLVCCFGGFAFVVDRRPEARFHAWQSILYDAAAFLLYLLLGLVLQFAGGDLSTSEPSSSGESVLDPFATIFLYVYYGGRVLLAVTAWLGRHVRLPLIGRFAETLAMRRF
jgi:uncharacterized membrane protein